RRLIQIVRPNASVVATVSAALKTLTDCLQQCNGERARLDDLMIPLRAIVSVSTRLERPLAWLLHPLSLSLMAVCPTLALRRHSLAFACPHELPGLSGNIGWHCWTGAYSTAVGPCLFYALCRSARRLPPMR
ncbi:MAG TPA: hypothetical protein VEY92_11205, partial [Pseudoxanthomonas sp.]|nr:hypothetical protein [Pseudoxanthomonas sp.]